MSPIGSQPGSLGVSQAVSSSWEESRAKFIAAAKRAGATLTTLEHDIDVAVVENGPGVVLVSSGTHGVEGYAGAAIQIA